MYPILLGEGAWALPSYFTMLMLGFFTGALLLRREAVRLGWDPVKMVDLCFVLVIASVVGARIAHVLFDGFLTDYIDLCIDPGNLAKPLPNGTSCVSTSQCVAAQNRGYNIGGICVDGACVPERDCFRALMFWSGGLTYYGGFILAVASAWFLARRWHWPFLQLTDIAAPLIALGLVFGRMGCFLAGCCFGKVTDVSWAVRFPQYSDAYKRHREMFWEMLSSQHDKTGIWESLPVHPTQLYELLGALAIFVFLWFYRRKRIAYTGQSLATLLIAYGILRFAIEFWRDDDRGGYWLSTSQWISIPLVVGGIALAVWGRFLAKRRKSDGKKCDGQGENLKNKTK